MLNLVTYDMLMLASACVIAAIGGLLSGIHFPSGKKWENLRKARGYLALSCFILAALSALHFLMRDNPKNESLRDAFVLVIGSSQALLFTMTLLTFIQPRYVRKRVIVPQVIAIVGIGGLLSLSLFRWEAAFPVVLHVALGGYVLQLAYYTVLFQKKYALCLEQMEAYYDEDRDNRLKWVQKSFYTALSIGIMALGTLFLGRWSYDVFLIIYTVFYVHMVRCFLNYSTHEVKFVLPAVTREFKSTDKEQYTAGLRTIKPRIMTEREQQFKAALEEWTKEKRFSEKDIGVEETAESLGTDAVFLRHYFRTYMDKDFRTWRSEQRIREAQRILEETPSMPLSQVLEAVGFNDKGNFHRQFQKITGTTPANYKQKCRDGEDKPVRLYRHTATGFASREHPV